MRRFEKKHWPGPRCTPLPTHFIPWAYIGAP